MRDAMKPMVIMTMPKPSGINAGKPTAKTLRLGEALEITPRQTLTISRPKIIGRTNDSAPIKICDDQTRKPCIALVLAKPAPIGSEVKLCTKILSAQHLTHQEELQLR